MTKIDFSEQAKINKRNQVQDAADESLYLESRAFAALEVAEEEARLTYAHFKAQGTLGDDRRAELARQRLFKIRVALQALRYGVDEEPLVGEGKHKVTSPSGCKINVVPR